MLSVKNGLGMPFMESATAVLKEVEKVHRTQKIRMLREATRKEKVKNTPWEL